MTSVWISNRMILFLHLSRLKLMLSTQITGTRVAMLCHFYVYAPYTYYIVYMVSSSSSRPMGIFSIGRAGESPAIKQNGYPPEE